MHVLIVTNLFPNQIEPHKGAFIFQFVEELKKTQRVTVISPIPYCPNWTILRKLPQSKYAQLGVMEQHEGYKVFLCRHLAIPKMGFLTPFLLFPPLLRMVQQIHSAEKVDVINAHWIFPDGVAAQWVGRILNFPTILTARGCDVNLYPNLFGRRSLIQHALSNCNAAVAVGEELRKTTQSLCMDGKEVLMIPNGIDYGIFHPMDQAECRRVLDWPENCKLILYVGSLDEVKNVDLLIEGFARVAEQRLKWDLRLIIVGAGHLLLTLEQLASKLGIMEYVSFMGQKSPPEIALLMNGADVLCLTSIREGRPNVILEALACGLPIVASRVGGVPELVTDDTHGYLFEVGNVEDFYLKLITALERYCGRKLAKTIQPMSWEISAGMYVKLYEKITNKVDIT